jgi:uncharacterized protein (DUF169 family)
MNNDNTASALGDSLNLALPAIAISLLATQPVGELADGITSFEGALPAGCGFWERAAKETFATTTADHELCAIGVHTHRMVGASAALAGELKTVLKVMSDMDYVRDEDVARIPVLNREVKCVVYGPLASHPLPVDVVLLFADSRDGLVISEAVDQVEGAAPPAMGRPACALVPQVANTGKAAASLGCCGARAYIDALTPSVALWGLPGATVAAYAARIATLARANATLGKFHELRREDVAAGGKPTIAASLNRLQG